MLYEGARYVILSALIDEHASAPRSLHDGEIYRVDPTDGIECFVGWLADAPAAFRARYVRAFIIGCCGYAAAISLATQTNTEVLHVYAR